MTEIHEEAAPTVAIICGGLSHEREVSVRSGRRVADALRGAQVDVRVLDADASLIPALMKDPPGVVFPLLHGQAGEDGAIRDVLELLCLPYVGSRPAACRWAFDKSIAKSVVAASGVQVPAGVVLPHATFRELGAQTVLSALVTRLGLPLVVKPARGGSALGASVVTSDSELPAALVAAFAYADTALVEARVLGAEVAVSVVDLGDGPKALPSVEIVPDSGFYDYAARYTAGATEFFVPPRLPPDVIERCEKAALTAHRALGLRHLSRSDLIVDAQGQPWFLEVNVSPGMTETSLLPQSVAAASMDLGEVCRTLAAGASASAATA